MLHYLDGEANKDVQHRVFMLPILLEGGVIKGVSVFPVFNEKIQLIIIMKINAIVFRIIGIRVDLISEIDR